MKHNRVTHKEKKDGNPNICTFIFAGVRSDQSFYLLFHRLKIVILFKSSIHPNTWRFNKHLCFNFEKKKKKIRHLQSNNYESPYYNLGPPVYSLNTTLLHTVFQGPTHSTPNATYQGVVFLLANSTLQNQKKKKNSCRCNISGLRIQLFNSPIRNNKTNAVNIMSQSSSTHSRLLSPVLRNNYILHCIVA